MRPLAAILTWRTWRSGNPPSIADLINGGEGAFCDRGYGVDGTPLLYHSPGPLKDWLTVYVDLVDVGTHVACQTESH